MASIPLASIQMLSEELIDQIAAGEVVERPASVVKELCENALDAGARQISVEIQEGGTRLVQVSDDGTGMGPTDARRSLLRHATSKLRDSAGLSAIATLGFRGEALPAIASVSRLTMTTRAESSLAAVRLHLSGGGEPEIEEVGAPLGTRVEVQDLFFNTPARRKFLKRVQTETQRATEVVSQLMLARPEVGFSLISNGRRLITSPPGADLRDRVAQALGADVHPHLISVEGRRGQVGVSGYVTSPDYSGATSQKIHLFVNRRAIRDRALAHAVGRAFANLLPPGRYPAAVIFVDLPLDRVDVNVHPQKLEVRFADPREVAEAIVRVISDALRPAPWLATKRALDWPAALVSPVPSDPTFRVGEEEVRFVPSAEPGAPGPPSLQGELRAVPGYFGGLKVIGQLARSYLVCEGPGGSLVVLDQHAAHERVLFERLRKAYAERAVPSQRLLIPAVVELGLAESEALEEHAGRLRTLGFELEPFGGQSWSIAAVPAPLARRDTRPLLSDLAGQLAQLGVTDAVEDAISDLLATIACHAAVRAHDSLAPEELRALLESLDSIDFKVRCPHGRPVVTEIPLAELERRVDRR